MIQSCQWDSQAADKNLTTLFSPTLPLISRNVVGFTLSKLLEKGDLI